MAFSDADQGMPKTYSYGTVANGAAQTVSPLPSYSFGTYSSVSTSLNLLNGGADPTNAAPSNKSYTGSIALSSNSTITMTPSAISLGFDFASADTAALITATITYTDGTQTAGVEKFLIGKFHRFVAPKDQNGNQLLIASVNLANGSTTQAVTYVINASNELTENS